jgi:hypothetical protein
VSVAISWPAGELVASRDHGAIVMIVRSWTSNPMIEPFVNPIQSMKSVTFPVRFYDPGHTTKPQVGAAVTRQTFNVCFTRD